MSLPLFQSNQVICFQTNYCKNRLDFTGYRYYLLKEIDEENKMLVFFPITSNRSREAEFYSQYKVRKRPSCLNSKVYPESFINTNLLIKVPLDLAELMEKNCRKVHQTCLEKEEFAEVIELHKFVVEFETILSADVRVITFNKEHFLINKKSK